MLVVHFLGGRFLVIVINRIRSLQVRVNKEEQGVSAHRGEDRRTQRNQSEKAPQPHQNAEPSRWSTHTSVIPKHLHGPNRPPEKIENARFIQESRLKRPSPSRQEIKTRRSESRNF